MSNSADSNRPWAMILVVGVPLVALVVFLVLAGFSVRLERRVEFVKPDAPVFTMILLGAPFEEIEAALAEDPNVVKEFCSQGESLLFHAVCKRRLDVVRLLLDMGADPDGVECEGRRSPLAAAVEVGDPRIAKILLEKGADPFLKGSFSGLTPFSPYDVALRRKSDEIIELMLEARRRREPLEAVDAKVEK